jgi:tryptophanyl-tRNA synthetase
VVTGGVGTAPSVVVVVVVVVTALAERYRSGIGWGDAKKALLDRLEQEVGEARTRYDALMADTSKIDALLAAGAAKARVTARKTVDRVRAAIGIS